MVKNQAVDFGFIHQENRIYDGIFHQHSVFEICMMPTNFISKQRTESAAQNLMTAAIIGNLDFCFHRTNEALNRIFSISLD